MVRKENIQARGNSLLQTATSKRAGPGRFASLVLRGTAKPPVKKVNVTRSDESRVSDMTASIVEDARPAVIKEVKIDDIEIESSVLEMSVKSGDVALKALGRESPLLGHQEKTTPQPPSFRLPPKKDGKPMEKKLMEIQPGIRITFPSPMSLDRVQVQMGQEHAAPASAEYIRQEEEKRNLEEMERQREEQTKTKKEVARKLMEDLHKEIGEGFEALLEDEPEESTPAKKKSLVSKILGKIRPKSPKKPITVDVARAMAREAIARSKKSQGLGRPPLPKRGEIPVQEITMSGKEDSVSDLDSSGKRNFPVKEILMGDGGDSRDDESISTLGTAHILERMRPAGSTILFPGRDGALRDPSPFEDFEPMNATEMFHPPAPKSRTRALDTKALIDQIDSGSLTEDAGEMTGGFGRCGPLGKGKVAASAIPKPSGLGLAAACIDQDTLQHCNGQPGCPHDENEDKPPLTGSRGNRQLEPPESRPKSEESPKSAGEKFTSVLDAAISSIQIGMNQQQSLDARGDSITDEVSHFSSIDIKKTLSPIDEEFSPINGEVVGGLKSMPELEEDQAENPIYSRPDTSQKSNDVEEGKVIDLTALASPMSPSTQDGVKGEKGAVTGAFSFDNLMDLAASRLKWNTVDDRYAVEGEESPRQVIRGHNVEGDVPDGSSIPVVQGVEIPRKKNLRNEITPKASGGSKSPTQLSSGLHRSTSKPLPHALASEVSPQSSFEVYEHPEGDIVMWSENPIQARQVAKTQTPAPSGFTGHFSDGLFDLLSMDESVSRGRKKVPFLSANPNDRQLVGTSTGSTSEMSKNLGDSNSQGMTMSTDASDKQMNNDEKWEGSSSDQELEKQHEKMDPSVGVMCGAVPLYFMYKNRNPSKSNTSDSKKITTLESSEDRKHEIVQGRGSPPLDSVEEKITVSPKPQPKGFLPMASPKKDHFTLQANDRIPPNHPSSDDNIKEPTKSTEEQKKPTVREKVLLDKDDAYWDTLSTIASTKDKRSGSGEITALAGDPGPIPIEITMNASNLNDGVSSRNSNSTLSEDKRRTTGFVIDMVGDEKSSDSLSRQLNTLFAEREVQVYSEARQTEGINEVRLLGKASTANVHDAFHDHHWEVSRQELDQSPAKKEAGKREHRNASDSNSEFTNENAATNISYPRNSYLELDHGRRDHSTFPTNHGVSSKAAKSGRDDVSDDNSGLLLAITRTEGDDDNSKVEYDISRHESQQMWPHTDLDNILLKAMQDKSCDDFYDGAKEAFEEATSRIVSTQTPTGLSQPENQHQVKSIGAMQEREDKLCDDFYDGAKAALNEATSYIVPTQGHSGWPQSDQHRSNRATRMTPENDRPGRGTLKSYPPKISLTTTPSTASPGVTSEAPRNLDTYIPRPFGDVLNSSFLPNPWNNASTRSVSWGFEEIYEEAEEVGSDVPRQVGSLPAPRDNRNKAIMTAAAEAAATKAALGQINTPFVAQPESSGNDSKMLSDIDEEELISRTLQLSKQLLASMRLQDLEWADNEIVKSLMSFGTEDGKFSLPEIPRDGKRESLSRPKDPPRAALFTDTSSDEETATQDKSSLAVADIIEVVGRTAIPESVHVSKATSKFGRALGSAAVEAGSGAQSHLLNAPPTSLNSDKTSTRSPTSSPNKPQSSPSWNRFHSKSIDQAPPTSVLDDNTPMSTSLVSTSIRSKAEATLKLSEQEVPHESSNFPGSMNASSTTFSTSNGILASPTSLPTSNANRSQTPTSTRHVNSNQQSVDFFESRGLISSPSSSMQIRPMDGSPSSSHQLGSLFNSPSNAASHQDESSGFSDLFGLSLFHSRQQIHSMNDAMTPASILRRLGSTPQELSSVESSGVSQLSGQPGSPIEFELSETSHAETLQGSHAATGGGPVPQGAIFHVLNRPTNNKEMMNPAEEDQQRHGHHVQKWDEVPITRSSSGGTSPSSNNNAISESTNSTNTSQQRSSEGSQNDHSTIGHGQSSEEELRSSFTPSTTSHPTVPIEEETLSLRPTGSGMTEDSPIDVESLFKKYDSLAHHLIEKNANLTERALMMTATKTTTPTTTSTSAGVVDGGMDENSTSTSTNSSSFNVVVSRLDQLRAKREKAVAVLQKNNTNRPYGNRVQGSSSGGVGGGGITSPREKNRVSHYATRPSSSKTTLMMMDLSSMEPESQSSGAMAVLHPPSSHHQQSRGAAAAGGDGVPDIETASTSSDRTTPSMKARELRRQLDEALQASHTIRKSQEQLGRELATFKNRFYRKTEELEDQAFRAIGGI